MRKRPQNVNKTHQHYSTFLCLWVVRLTETLHIETELALAKTLFFLSFFFYVHHIMFVAPFANTISSLEHLKNRLWSQEK